MRNRWAAAAVAWLALIFFSSTSIAGERSERAYEWVATTLLHEVPHLKSNDWLHFLAAKSVHVTLFTVFAIFLWNAIPVFRWHFALVILIGLVTGICSELLQRLFPNRDPAVRDVLINLGATTLGATIMWLRSRRALSPETH